MKLSNFEEVINPLILDRGEGYYHIGAIKSFTKSSETLFEFDIAGSIMYSVIIELKKDKDSIAFTACDCPYDKGPCCKHVVTALYYLRNQYADSSGQTTTSELDKLLSSYEKSELKNLILELLDKYPAEKDKLLIKHIDFNKDNEKEMVTETIYEIIESYKGYYDFVNYEETMELTDELHEVLENIEKTTDKQALISSLLFFYTEVVKLVTFCDDSAGSVGTLLNNIIAEITSCLAQASFKHASEELLLLTALEQTISDPVYDDWQDAAIDLVAAFKGNLFEKDSRDFYYGLIDRRIETLDDKSGVYYYPMLHLLKAAVIKEYETDGAYVQYLEENEEVDTVKKELLSYLLEQKRYKEVVKKIEKIKSKREYSSRKDFMKIEFEAYRGLKNIPKQESLGKDLIMKGEFEYYIKVREVTPDPDDFYLEIKTALREKLPDFLVFDVYKRLLLLEDDREGLLELTKLHMPLIETVVDLLRESYPKEAFDIYTQYLYQVAENTANRKEYRALCYKISAYGRLFGNMHKQEVIEKLEKQYNRKPALLDELGKI